MFSFGCQTESDRALRVREGRHAPGVEDVEGLRQQGGAELGGAGGAGVGGLDGDVAVPVRRHAPRPAVGPRAATEWPSSLAIE